MEVTRLKIFVFFTIALSGCSSEPEIGSEAYYLLEARNEVAAKLKDPLSAQFKNLKVTQKGAVCGKVNGKNSFGAYTGFQDFVYLPVVSDAANIENFEIGAFLPGDVTLEPDPHGQHTDFSTLYTEHCLGINRARQVEEKAAFLKKFGD